MYGFRNDIMEADEGFYYIVITTSYHSSYTSLYLNEYAALMSIDGLNGGENGYYEIHTNNPMYRLGPDDRWYTTEKFIKKHGKKLTEHIRWNSCIYCDKKADDYSNSFNEHLCISEICQLKALENHEK